MNDRNEHFRDRKLELGISEILGAEQPPDLAKKILAGGAEDDNPAVLPDNKHKSSRWQPLLVTAMAISLLLVLGGFVASLDWSDWPSERTVTRVMAVKRQAITDGQPQEARHHARHQSAPFDDSRVCSDPRSQEELGPLGDVADSPADMSATESPAFDLSEAEPTTERALGELNRSIEANDPDAVALSVELDPARLRNASVGGVAAAEEPRYSESREEQGILGSVRGMARTTERRDLESRAEKRILEDQLAAEKAARRQGLATLESRDRELRERLAAVEQRNAELVQSERQPVAAMESSQRDVVAIKDEVAGLRSRIQTEALDRDGQFERVAKLTDEVHGARTVRARLEERRDDLSAELAKRREVLHRNGISADDLPERVPPQVGAVITAVSKSGLVEVSIGTDDGLREGHQLEVFSGSSYLGRINIRKTSPDRAVGEIIPEFRKGDITKGARVATRLSSSGEDQVAKIDPATKKPAEPKKTWRRAKASPNAARLVIGDKDELLPAGVQANVVVDGFRARVLLDWYFYNDRGRRLEGNFKLRLPNDASLYYLAFGPTSFEYRPQTEQLASRGFLPPEVLRSTGTGPQEILQTRQSTWGSVKEARVVPRQKAAYAYSETVRRRVDPALAEWAGAGVFQCRVFPLDPGKLHRIVVGYDVNLPRLGDDLTYEFDVPEGVPECTVDINVSALPGTEANIAPPARPFVSGGRAFYHFEQPASDKIAVRLSTPESILLTGTDGSAGDFFATRVRPKLPAGKEKTGSSHAIFLVDTSLSSQPEKFNTYLDLLAVILEKNRDSLDHFAVLFFNIESYWWQDGYVENTPENTASLIGHCHTLALEGATDLKQALAEAARPQWQQDQAGELPRADLFLLSDGAVTWGEDNLHMIGKTLSAGTAGPLFAYKTGQSGTASDVLEHMTRETGGAVFSIAGDEEIAAAATAHCLRPWTLLDVSIEGGDDLLVSGRPRSVYPDQQLTIVGRGAPQVGSDLVMKVKRGDQLRTVRVPMEQAIQSKLPPRAYGQVAVGQLEDLMPVTEETSVAYARHFRVPGHSCSLLMLDSEADYQRFQIKPEADSFLVRSFPAAEIVTRILDETAARRGDPKAAVVDWIDRLQQMQGFQLQLPTATKLAIEKMPARVFEVDVPRLLCSVRSRNDLPEQFVDALDAPQLDYGAVNMEARRRLTHDSSADALKALSCLLERNPGDMVLLRDVAFSAMEWGFGGQAYPLLRRVAVSRPYEPQVYTAMARCLAELGHADLAMVYYELAISGQWSGRYKDFGKIARMEYVHVLRRIKAGELESCVPDFAAARLASLRTGPEHAEHDLIVMMEWNTDRTDVDLHVAEPSGEVCSYKYKTTRSAGRITDDVTEGFGPEMYTLANAPDGKYTVRVHYYGSDNNRTSARTKVYLTVYRYYGTPHEQVERHAVTLEHTKNMQDVATVGMPKRENRPR